MLGVKEKHKMNLYCQFSAGKKRMKDGNAFQIGSYNWRAKYALT